MHMINLKSFSEKTSKSDIEESLNKEARHASDTGSELPNSIRWLTPIFDTYEDAEKYLNEQDDGWYDQLAVRYRILLKTEYPKSYTKLQEKCQEAYSKYEQLNNEVPFPNFKSEYISCKECGSKLNTKYIKSNKCPLCYSDMRSETTLNRIKQLNKKYKELQNELKIEEQKIIKKNLKKASTSWLVKYEYHV